MPPEGALAAAVRWREEWPDAACRGADPNLFFPPATKNDKVRPDWETKATPTNPTEAALFVCRGCPRRAECLDLALRFGQSTDYGVWGATTPIMRRRLRRQRRSRP